jgi:hypothetical protein
MSKIIPFFCCFLSFETKNLDQNFAARVRPSRSPLTRNAKLKLSLIAMHVSGEKMTREYERRIERDGFGNLQAGQNLLSDFSCEGLACGLTSTTNCHQLITLASAFLLLISKL